MDKHHFVASGAYAQSNVTVFGVVDTAVSVGTGSIANKTAMTSPGYLGSRLGFRGTEDLGAGMKANFWLEAGFTSDDGVGAASSINNQVPVVGIAQAGAQGLTFNRRSYLSLSGGFGEVQLGRDYTPLFIVNTTYDPFGSSGSGASRALLGTAGAYGSANSTAVRASNMISYTTPPMGGFAAQVMTYFGENASNDPAGTTPGTGSGLRLAYASGPFSVGLGWNKVGVTATSEVNSLNIGGSYDFGVAKVMALYSTDDVSAAARVVKGYLVGVIAPLGSGFIRASYSATNNGAAAAAETKQLALGYVHSLSKRTDIYVNVVSVDNSGGAAAALNGAVTAANASSSAFDLGIKHAF